MFPAQDFRTELFMRLSSYCVIDDLQVAVNWKMTFFIFDCVDKMCPQTETLSKVLQTVCVVQQDAGSSDGTRDKFDCR